MKKGTPKSTYEAMPETKAVLEEVLREGAQRLSQAALKTESLEHLNKYRELRVDRGRRGVVRNAVRLKRLLDDFYIQCSNLKFSNLSNSFVLLVTRIKFLDIACAAICKSYGPMIFPPSLIQLLSIQILQHQHH